MAKKKVTKKPAAVRKTFAARTKKTRRKGQKTPRSRCTGEIDIQAEIEVLAAGVSLLAKQLPQYKGLKYNNLYSLVLSCGREFTPTPKPENIRWGKEKNCYGNAFEVMLTTGLTYCEGFAVSISPGCPMVVDHAWCVDGNGNVVDNTWKELGIVYYGIPLTTTFVARTVGKSGITGVFHNNRVLLEKGVPKNAVVKIGVKGRKAK